MATRPEVLDSNEFDELKKWFTANQELLPQPIQGLQYRLIETYSKLTKNKNQQKKLLAEMNRLMGFSQSSEKGSSQKHW